MFYIRVYIYIYTYPHDIPFLPPFHRFVSLLSRCWCMHATAAVVQGRRLLRDFGALYGAGENAWEGMQRFFFGHKWWWTYVNICEYCGNSQERQFPRIRWCFDLLDSLTIPNSSKCSLETFIGNPGLMLSIYVGIFWDIVAGNPWFTGRQSDPKDLYFAEATWMVSTFSTTREML